MPELKPHSVVTNPIERESKMRNGSAMYHGVTGDDVALLECLANMKTLALHIGEVIFFFDDTDALDSFINQINHLYMNRLDTKLHG